eukprot:TRINITY_DN8768_c0_g1_i1.p1 TRINITY_DN8768_c0_g1~~TRINITY_DN8768_c0_g1_i1.p1  ORF type:complete len:550 (+),score=41.72 TRINITY_DN8768_c0_g1_i1:910-2559(+)
MEAERAYDLYFQNLAKEEASAKLLLDPNLRTKINFCRSLNASPSRTSKRKDSVPETARGPSPSRVAEPDENPTVFNSIQSPDVSIKYSQAGKRMQHDIRGPAMAKTFREFSGLAEPSEVGNQMMNRSQSVLRIGGRDKELDNSKVLRRQELQMRKNEDKKRYDELVKLNNIMESQLSALRMRRAVIKMPGIRRIHSTANIDELSAIYPQGDDEPYAFTEKLSKEAGLTDRFEREVKGNDGVMFTHKPQHLPTIHKRSMSTSDLSIPKRNEEEISKKLKDSNSNNISIHDHEILTERVKASDSNLFAIHQTHNLTSSQTSVTAAETSAGLLRGRSYSIVISKAEAKKGVNENHRGNLASERVSREHSRESLNDGDKFLSVETTLNDNTGHQVSQRGDSQINVVDKTLILGQDSSNKRKKILAYFQPMSASDVLRKKVYESIRSKNVIKKESPTKNGERKNEIMKDLVTSKLMTTKLLMRKTSTEIPASNNTSVYQNESSLNNNNNHFNPLQGLKQTSAVEKLHTKQMNLLYQTTRSYGHHNYLGRLLHEG